MAANAGKLVTKAAVAAAFVGGGAIATASAAGADAPAPAPPAPSPVNDFLNQVGQRIWQEHGDEIVELGGKVNDFVQGLRPADDPNTAEVAATPEHSSGTAWQSDDDAFVLGRSEAAPNSAKVTILRAFGHDLLTKEGDADGGHYGGEWAGLGQVIDRVNAKTCPSGVHGGEELCITFLDSSATTREVAEGEAVSVDVPLRPLVEGALPSAIRNSSNPELAAIINAFLDTLNVPLTATGTSQGTSTQNDAAFDLVKVSKGGDSIVLLPTSARSGSADLAPGVLRTDPYVVNLAPLKSLIQGSSLPSVVKLLANAIPNTTTIGAQLVQFPGAPRTCASSAGADTVVGTGALADLGAFLDTPTSGGASAGCEAPVAAPV